MSGSATLTMNMSRLARTTPAHTIASTTPGDASPRRMWAKELMAVNVASGLARQKPVWDPNRVPPIRMAGRAAPRESGSHPRLVTDARSSGASRGPPPGRPLGCALAQRDIEIVDRDPMSGRASQLDGHRVAAPPVAKLERAPLVVEPAIPPLHQRSERREEIVAFLGEPVLLARALSGFPIVLAHEQALVDELAQACRRDGLADADALGELVEARRAVERLAEDQEGRARADHVERLGERATVGGPRLARREPPGQLRHRGHGQDPS